MANIRNWVKPVDFEKMKDRADKEEAFNFKSEVKSGGRVFSVRIDGRFVDKSLAEEVWHGKDYLIGFQEDHWGKGDYSGRGFCTEKKEMFENWESFKEWFDQNMKHLGGYEVEEYGQVSLF